MCKQEISPDCRSGAGQNSGQYKKRIPGGNEQHYQIRDKEYHRASEVLRYDENQHMNRRQRRRDHKFFKILRIRQKPCNCKYINDLDKFGRLYGNAAETE